MLTLDFGLFPLMGLMVGGVLYAVERHVLRLKCTARWVQAFIAVSVGLTLLASVVKPVREVYVVVPTASSAHAASHRAAEATAAPMAWDESMLPDNAPDGAMTMLQSDATAGFGTVYVAGVTAVALYFVLQLCWLFSLRRRYPMSEADGYSLYLTDAQPPFSFGRSVFMPDRLDETVCRYVLIHELAHIRHRHFLKLCALQVLVALNWYNPFVWLLFGVMRLQQEFEVDADVLGTGVDREAYQLSLLHVCTQDGKWILLRSTFGLKPLKQRIIFMNKQMNATSVQHRKTAAALCLFCVVVLTAVVGCRQREVINSEVARHHPMRGCWTMDWISNTGSGEEVHPMAMHYGFYNDSTFLCFSYWRKQGVELSFSVSGEGYTWRGDSLLDAAGNLTDYKMIDERTALSRWLKDSTQMAGVSGPDITEQWSRIRPNADVVAIFRAAIEAAPRADRPLDGVWMRETSDADNARTGNGKSLDYCFVNDSILLNIHLNPTTVAAGFRYGGAGFRGQTRHADLSPCTHA